MICFSYEEVDSVREPAFCNALSARGCRACRDAEARVRDLAWKSHLI